MRSQQSSRLATDPNPSDSAQRRKRLPKGMSGLRRPLVASVAALALLLGWSLVETLYGNARIPSELRSEFQESSTASVVVTLDFEPERFHLAYFQERATLSNVEGRQISLLNVTEDAAKDIAGEYWVADIQLLDEN